MAAAEPSPRRVGFVGAGRMAGAIAQGLIRAAILQGPEESRSIGK
ncbi:PYCR3 isoform 3 [Pan troglodytes]|uniref:Pyrroline-5-carboxylate reductase 3 n=2 Tax=Homininae TaxID=207598 RepID=F8WEI0_HUMAN|nr:PYCR3 isoform 3 [Pan troglodytes]